MIYYFSGTGNSQWAAQELARLTGDEAVNLAQRNPDGPDSLWFGPQSCVGLVFPIYAWAPPKMVMEFARSIHMEPNAFCYALCTCGDEAGRGMERLRRVFPWNSAYSLQMPNNYLPLYDVDSPELAREKVAKAQLRLKEIAGQINRRQPVEDVFQGSWPRLKTAVAAPLFQAFAMSDKPFFAEDSCTGCGLCANVCPAGNIRLAEGKPHWRGHCMQCQACIHRCPVRAIQYGRGTREKGRYYFGKKDGI